MTKLLIYFTAFALATASLEAQVAHGHTWVVLTGPGLDARLRREITSLAQRERARARFVQDNEQASLLHVADKSLTLKLSAEIDLTIWNSEMAREGYHLIATFPKGQGLRNIQLHASTAAGFHNGLRRIPELLRLAPEDLADFSSRLYPAAKSATTSEYAEASTASIVDYPSFLERGIVEGFYGKPWSHQDRMAALRFEGEHGMNVYYYAPKDDPYHRERWKAPYPTQQFQRLGELARAANENFVEFCFAISPGLTMRYSSEEDFSRLALKLESVGKLGISCFALFLDDVPPELQQAADREQFKTLAEAHAALINRLDDHLKAQGKGYRLVVTPTTYTNAWGNREYIRELGLLTNQDVPLVWTGMDTFSPVITSAQAREWGDIIRRPPLVWDNFPVNDATPWRPFLGPLVGRDPLLAGAVRGLVANPMNQPRASRIPLATIADYLWNPEAYSPERSHQKAIAEQVGEHGAQLLEPFLKTYGDYFWDENIFTPLFYDRRAPLDIPAIQDRLRQLDSAMQTLRREPEFKEIAAELAPFMVRTRKRLADVLASPAYLTQPDGKLAVRKGYDEMEAPRLAAHPTLDGDFSKWESGVTHTVNLKTQAMRGADFWKGPEQFSARAAFAWDKDFLYIGVDVIDNELYQPFRGRGIDDGDYVSVSLQTAFRKNYSGTRATGDEYRIFFSPGNFSGNAPSLFSYEDYLPPRNRPHNHAAEIRTAWRRTATGYSGDIAIPASYFDAGALSERYEIGLGFSVQNIYSSPAGRGARKQLRKTVLISKDNSLFPVYLSNPSSYPRLVLGK